MFRMDMLILAQLNMTTTTKVNEPGNSIDWDNQSNFLVRFIEEPELNMGFDF